MTSRDFVYWLQGYFEISKPTTISFEQTQMIQKHLNLVFKHEIDPSMGDEKHQKELNIIHQKPELNFDHNKVYNIQGTDNPMVRC